MKKIVTLFLLSAILIFSCFLYGCSEATDFTYVVEGDEVTITGYTGNKTELTLPYEIEGKPVTRIGEGAFRNNTRLEYVIIPMAFQTVVDASGKAETSLIQFKEIGDEAFMDCTKLKAIFIPWSTERIGEYAFYNTKNLTQAYTASQVITSNGETPEETLWEYEYILQEDTSYLLGMLSSELKSIGAYAFAKSGLTSLSANLYCDIGERAFSECKSLGGEISLFDCDIGKFAFYKTAIENLSLTNVGFVGESAFLGCDQLKKLWISNVSYLASWIPTSVEEIILQYTGNESDLYTIVGGLEQLDFDKLYCLDGTKLSEKYDDISMIMEKRPQQDGAYYFVHELTKTATLICCSDDITELIIPQKISYNQKEYTVTAIGKYALYGSNVNTVKIPDTVTEIGDNAITDSSVKDIYISNLALWCEIGAFPYLNTANNRLYLNDELITELVIPEGVSAIGDGAFRGCGSIESVKFTIENTEIGEGAFYNCENLKSLTIPLGITEIKDTAFANCISLATVMLPDTVESIGERAFSGCTSLVSINIPKSMRRIESSAFSGCSRLIEVINNSAISIGTEHSSCLGMYAMEIHTGGAKIVNKDGLLFYTYSGWVGSGTYLVGYVGEDTEVVLPDSYEGKEYVIHKEAFYGSNNLTKITIGKNVKDIGKEAFWGCTNLTEINFNATAMKDLDDEYAQPFGWHNNEAAEFKVNIGANVTRIPAYLFYENKSITEVKFANGSVCTEIGDGAFRSCTKLVSVNIPDKMSNIGYAFHFNCDSLSSISVGENNPNYLSIDGNLYSKNGKTLILYAKGKADTVFTIPDGVTTIEDNAFFGCDNLESVIIPDSTTTIYSCAFDYCHNLESIIIGNGVKSIGDNCFNSCYDLESIKYRGTEAQWNNISKGAGWDDSAGKYTHAGTYTITYNYSE